jgi:glycerophosphoryl diester phosphodiesterase
MKLSNTLHLITIASVLLLLSNSLCASNIGHRASGGESDGLPHLPENSLIALQTALTGENGGEALQFRENFDYLEFDIRETFDGELVVFHDRDIKRMVDYQGTNQAVIDEILADQEFQQRKKGKSCIPIIKICFKRNVSYKNLRIEDLTLEEIKRLRLKGEHNQEIPTFQEFLDTALEHGLFKPMVVEIKYLATDQARQQLLDSLIHFREMFIQSNIVYTSDFDFPQPVSMMTFKKSFKKSFGKYGSSGQRHWCNKAIESGFQGIFKPFNHSYDHCAR